MKQLLQRTKRRMTSPAFLRMSLAAFVIALCVTQQELLAQRFTNSPALNTAVQGQQANQVEGSFFNFVNWVGGTMAPIGAGVTAVVAIVKSFSGRGYAMWWAGTGGLVGVSMLVRLIEAFVTQGTGGVGGGS